MRSALWVHIPDRHAHHTPASLVVLTTDTVQGTGITITVVLADHDTFDYGLVAEARLVLDIRTGAFRVPSSCYAAGW